MEEQNQQLKQIIFDVVVGFLQAEDAWREERLVFIQGHLVRTVPGEKSKLEDVFQNHHHLGRGKTTSFLSVSN